MRVESMALVAVLGVLGGTVTCGSDDNPAGTGEGTGAEPLRTVENAVHVASGVEPGQGFEGTLDEGRCPNCEDISHPLCKD